eukprot:PhF_6_TR32405/c0_g1_i1/m.48077
MHFHAIVPYEPLGPEEEMLPGMISNHIVPQNIFRTTQSSANIRRQTMGQEGMLHVIGAAPTLREVTSYVSNLQDCWRRSVQLNVDMERVQDSKAEQLRKIREELRQKKQEVSQLSETVRVHTMTGEDYTNEYERLHKEMAKLIILRKGNMPISSDDP